MYLAAGSDYPDYDDQSFDSDMEGGAFACDIRDRVEPLTDVWRWPPREQPQLKVSIRPTKGDSMAIKRKLPFNDMTFRGASIKMGAEPITTLTVTCPFTQVDANLLGCKDRIYGGVDDEDNGDVRAWVLGIELFGPKITVKPKQGTLDGKVSINGNGVEFVALKVDKFYIKKQARNETLDLAFHISVLDEEGTVHGLLHGVKKDIFDLTIVPANKETAAEAQEKFKFASKGAASEEEEEPEAEGAETATVEK
jgi:hypothetical protein